MKITEWKPIVLDAVAAAAAAANVVKFKDVRAAVAVATAPRYIDNRDLDRVLQALRREASIRYLAKHDPKTGKPRKRWGWQPAAKKGRR